MNAPAKSDTVTIERESLEADLEVLRKAEELILDAALIDGSERNRLLAAVMELHAVNEAIRAYLMGEQVGCATLMVKP